MAPPVSTGKTHYSAQQAKSAVEKYGPEGVMLLSLTKAAAAEIGGRDTGVDEDLCSTIHAQCFRMTEGLKVVAKKNVDVWNNTYPHWQISPATMGTSTEVLNNMAFGDEFYARCDLLEHQLVPREDWSGELIEFSDAWNKWLEEHELIDFTGMLVQTLTHKRKPRFSLGAIIADEVQDFSPLEMAILRQWSRFVEVLVMVGDLHQSLYAFRGATTESLDGEVFKILSQSYRVPKQPFLIAKAIMDQMTEIKPVEFAPRDHEGEVVRGGGGFKQFASYLPEIEHCIKEGRSIMLLATCGYMLHPVVKRLREEGIPYWNPYSTKNRSWNPLTPKLDQGAISLSRRFRAFIDGDRGNFTIEEFGLMTKMFSKCWARGGKKLLAESPLSLNPIEVGKLLPKILKPEAWDDFYEYPTDPAKMQKWVIPAQQRAYDFMCRVYEKRGKPAFLKEPQVIVGTIHSVKGGEADTVVVFPDLSQAAHEQWQTHGWEGRDSILRLFYVAVTRTRDKLILASPSTSMYAGGW